MPPQMREAGEGLNCTKVSIAEENRERESRNGESLSQPALSSFHETPCVRPVAWASLISRMRSDWQRRVWTVFDGFFWIAFRYLTSACSKRIRFFERTVVFGEFAMSSLPNLYSHTKNPRSQYNATKYRLWTYIVQPISTSWSTFHLLYLSSRL